MRTLPLLLALTLAAPPEKAPAPRPVQAVQPDPQPKGKKKRMGPPKAEEGKPAKKPVRSTTRHSPPGCLSPG